MCLECNMIYLIVNVNNLYIYIYLVFAAILAQLL